MFQENAIGLEAKIKTALEEVKRSVCDLLLCSV
jgi:hypothetical protein